MKKIPTTPLPWWGKPKIKVCIVCSEEYEFYKKGTYDGKSSKSCPECQIRYKEMSIGFSGDVGSRSGGHRTRQQHKRVHSN